MIMLERYIDDTLYEVRFQLTQMSMIIYIMLLAICRCFVFFFIN